MTYRTKAIYRGGAFVPETQCDLPEDAEVDLLVQGPVWPFRHVGHRSPQQASNRLLRQDYRTHEAKSDTRRGGPVHAR